MEGAFAEAAREPRSVKREHFTEVKPDNFEDGNDGIDDLQNKPKPQVKDDT